MVHDKVLCRCDIVTTHNGNIQYIFNKYFRNEFFLVAVGWYITEQKPVRMMETVYIS